MDGYLDNYHTYQLCTVVTSMYMGAPTYRMLVGIHNIQLHLYTTNGIYNLITHQIIQYRLRWGHPKNRICLPDDASHNVTPLVKKEPWAWYIHKSLPSNMHLPSF